MVYAQARLCAVVRTRLTSPWALPKKMFVLRARISPVSLLTTSVNTYKMSCKYVWFKIYYRLHRCASVVYVELCHAPCTCTISVLSSLVIHHHYYVQSFPYYNIQSFQYTQLFLHPLPRLVCSIKHHLPAASSHPAPLHHPPPAPRYRASTLSSLPFNFVSLHTHIRSLYA